jgi:hypothetical protein
MRALSIRQPYAELILRGAKTIEYRTRPTRIVGQRFYIYASKAKAARPIWSESLRVGTPPRWMVELAEQVGMIEPGTLLPTGVIVGSAVIDRVVPIEPSLHPSSHSLQLIYEWHLSGVERARTLRRPTHQPQPVWFTPF